MICRHRSHWKARPCFFIGWTHTGQSGVIGSGERLRPPAVRGRSDRLRPYGTGQRTGTVATAIRANLCERKRLASKHFMTLREDIFDCPVASGVQTFWGIWSKRDARGFCPRLHFGWWNGCFGGFHVRKILLSSVAVFAFSAAGHADELSDIQAQSKQLREQNQALAKRLADLEKRQQKLEKQQPAVASGNLAEAMAADLPYKAAVKAPAAVNDDLCWHGVCVYGNIDMGLNYQNHGAPLSPLSVGPLNYLVSKQSLGSYFGVGPNQLSTSFIGLRGKREIADGLYAVFNLQSQFDPASGQLSNGIGAIQANNGLSLAQQTGFSDSSKAGQMFNGVAYAGLSSPIYGTLTYGRQNALSSDLVTNYDAISGSNAWSVLTYQGASGGGGDTEKRIYDNSFEYRVDVGPVRFAVETQLRNGGNSGTGNAFEGDVGFDYLGLSMDFVGGKIYDAVAAAPLSAAQVLAVPVTPVPTGLGPVAGAASDNTVLQIARQ